MKKVFLITFFLFFSFKVHSLEVTLTQGSVKANSNSCDRAIFKKFTIN